MKKIILSAAVILSLTAISCRKERTCECKTTSTQVRSGNNGTYVDNTSTKVTMDKQKKKTFKNQQNCFSKSYSFTGDGVGNSGPYTYVTTVEESCEVK